MIKKKLRFLFIVQSEGRGHLTQAVALHQLLVESGHEVCAILIGENVRRKLPDFILGVAGTEVRRYPSPTFVVDAQRKGIRLGQTLLGNLGRLPSYLKTLCLIRDHLRRTKPDVIVNFYEILAGLSFVLFGTMNADVVCVGHQYLLPHPDLARPPGRHLERQLLLLCNRLTALKASRRLALSFRPMSDLPGQKMYVCPPLLRNEVLEMEGIREDFLLVYLLNDGYADEIAAWHQNHRELKIVGFWDRAGAGETTTLHENLIFHQLSGARFLSAMRRCRAFVSTAGFESICEALYLGKPSMLVPTGGHFEQQCNAVDAVQAGAGMTCHRFDLERFQKFLEGFQLDNSEFRNWAQGAKAHFLRHLTAGKAG